MTLLTHRALATGAFVLLCAAGADAQEASSAAPGERPQALTGVVQGVVHEVAYARQSVVVDSASGSVALRARGADLARFVPGDVVSLEYEIYDGVPWLKLEELPNVTGPRYPPAGRLGNAIGYVLDVTRGAGLIVVGGPTPELGAVTGVAHPAQLEGIVPGQMVSIDYVYLGIGHPTVLRIQPSTVEDAIERRSSQPGAR